MHRAALFNHFFPLMHAPHFNILLKIPKCHFRNCIRCFLDFMDVMDELMLLRFIHRRVSRCCSNRAAV